MNSKAATRISREIVINAPSAKIFEALTEPKQLAKWWGDEQFYKWTNVEHDFRVQGAWEMSGSDARGNPLSIKGVYRTIEAPFELYQTWAYDFSQSGFRDSMVRYSLRERDGVTRLSMTHTGFRLSDKRGRSKGWTSVLGWLRRYAEQPFNAPSEPAGAELVD
ncbi:MAG: SRPBCC domain-containing protein [Candidatus Eremiobacteraeota bacterium]|nr:SRPBCC domain-containing protein [Candidatus Eremiobacteraeota bacterium]